jgi:hypothetical protein
MVTSLVVTGLVLSALVATLGFVWLVLICLPYSPMSPCYWYAEFVQHVCSSDEYIVLGKCQCGTPILH